MSGYRIFLVGPRACGKTTLALYLAHNHNYRAIDLDSAFSEMFSQEAFVAANGWRAFREKEGDVFRTVLGKLDPDCDTVVSTGGGLVLDKGNRRLLRESGLVVYLYAPEDELVRRLRADPKSKQRPRFAKGTLEEEVRATMAERAKLYESVADCTVNTMMPLDTITDQIFSRLFRREIIKFFPEH